jgi:transcriptional regulator with PAS, ATPase and Fis domain
MINSEEHSRRRARHAGALRQVDQLPAFSHSCAVTFVICDQQFRYQWVNDAVVAWNGILAEAHVGRTLEDVIGEAATAIEPILNNVLSTGKVISKELVVKTPKTNNIRHWVSVSFPVKNNFGAAKQAGVVGVEITKLRELDKLFSEVSRDLVCAPGGNHHALRKELHGSLSQYFAALGVNLRQLTRHFWDPNKSADGQSAPLIEPLDTRMAAVRSVANSVADLLQIDLQRE